MFTMDLTGNYPSAFSLGQFIGTEIDVKDMFDSMLLTLLPSLPVYKTYFITHLERRPDLISYDVYKTTDMAFWIMAYNGVLSHEELVSGVRLELFKFADFSALVDRIRGQANADPALAPANKGAPNAAPFLAILR